MDNLDDIKNSNQNLETLINKQAQIDLAKKQDEENKKQLKNEANKIKEDLKNYLKQYLTSEIAPSLLEQIKTLENAIKSDDHSKIKTQSQSAKKFIELEILAPIKKAEEDKRIAE